MDRRGQLRELSVLSRCTGLTSPLAKKNLKQTNMVITDFSENISKARIIKWLTYKPVLVLPYIIIADECPMNNDNGHMAHSSSSLLVKRVLFACYCITYNRKMWILRQLHLQSTDWSDAPPKIAPVASTSAQKVSLKQKQCHLLVILISATSWNSTLALSQSILQCSNNDLWK